MAGLQAVNLEDDMATKLYRCEIPVQLAVEADSKAEAERIMYKLWDELLGELPVGVSAFAKEGTRRSHIHTHTRLV